MLDTDTKRRIDTARDILVGKVPDPKSQVEQITIALIYKFMDDIDLESEELGGHRKFFAGEYARYGWAKLMRSGLGGHEILNLYAEAIAKMPENPGIPPLFRDIFKNAFLPYRDPETLRAFLKVIDEFSYDHSERLGDAFEYLLSVLGSQGDAGQFRTPRHIIDFIVKVVDPQKDETILDPACGTAGFLISSYKHILKGNLDDNGQSTLTPDDRKRLAENFKGYDISPDMIRLSLVNMYLHGFTDPHINEYDTLTSQDKWNEYADVILANPPFMSPKGGIRPHNRFSVQSKRSEVLFVDYMAEHLTPNGRAGIIVPEGIIFQSQTAYKQLRKMLVEDYLVAVISLPAGVFNPYSGVKTSILILDKSLAKQTDVIAFFKVENDGFGLGAQRRPIDKNDLPQVSYEVIDFLQKIVDSRTIDDFHLNHGLLVQKEKISADSDFNLSGERYRITAKQSSVYPFVKISDICETKSGGTPLKGNESYYEGGSIPWLRSGEVSQGQIYQSELYITDEGLKNSSAKIFPKNTVLVAMYGATAGEVGILRIDASTNQAICGLTPQKQLSPDFLYLVLKHNKAEIIRFAGGGAQPNISQKIIRGLEIPLPPLDVQKEIVAEIDGYQKVIDGARAVIDNYRPHIPIDPEWPMVSIGDKCSLMTGGTPTSSRKDYYENGLIPWLVSGDIHKGDIYDCDGRITEDGLQGSNARYLPKDSVLIALNGQGKTRGTVAYLKIDNATCNQSLVSILPNNTEEVHSRYLYYFLQSKYQEIRNMTGDNQRSGLNMKIIRRIEFPLPPVEEQNRIISDIELEETAVIANKNLIPSMENKIQATLGRVWGEGK